MRHTLPLFGSSLPMYVCDTSLIVQEMHVSLNKRHGSNRANDAPYGLRFGCKFGANVNHHTKGI